MRNNVIFTIAELSIEKKKKKKMTDVVRVVLEHALRCANCATDQLSLVAMRVDTFETHVVIAVDVLGHFWHGGALARLCRDLAHVDARVVAFDTEGMSPPWPPRDSKNSHWRQKKKKDDFARYEPSTVPFRCSDGEHVHLLPEADATLAHVPGASLTLHVASSDALLVHFESAEAFGALCLLLDDVMLRLPLTMLTLELNGATRFESASFRALEPDVVAALSAQLGGASLLSKETVLSTMLLSPHSSRLVVESALLVRARTRSSFQITVIAHLADGDDDGEASAPFAIEFLRLSTPAHGLLARDGARGALLGALSSFARGGVSFVLDSAATVPEVLRQPLFAAFRDEASARVLGLARNVQAVELVIDVADELDELVVGDTLGALVTRALTVAVDALTARQPLLLERARVSMERRAVEFAAVALAVQAVQQQSQCAVFAAQMAATGDATRLLERLCARVYAEARDESASCLLAMVAARVQPNQLLPPAAADDVPGSGGGADEDESDLNACHSSTASM